MTKAEVTEIATKKLGELSLSKDGAVDEHQWLECLQDAVQHSGAVEECPHLHIALNHNQVKLEEGIGFFKGGAKLKKDSTDGVVTELATLVRTLDHLLHNVAPLHLKVEGYVAEGVAEHEDERVRLSMERAGAVCKAITAAVCADSDNSTGLLSPGRALANVRLHSKGCGSDSSPRIEVHVYTDPGWRGAMAEEESAATVLQGRIRMNQSQKKVAEAKQQQAEASIGAGAGGESESKGGTSATRDAKAAKSAKSAAAAAAEAEARADARAEEEAKVRKEWQANVMAELSKTIQKEIQDGLATVLKEQAAAPATTAAQKGAAGPAKKKKAASPAKKAVTPAAKKTPVKKAAASAVPAKKAAAGAGARRGE
jgi:hypothetical protein